ncbi:MAG: wax ester/triacylglycerol synthase domain-containing protein, partial [Marinobacter alexandrii]
MTITVMLRVDGLTAPRLREFLQVYWLAWERFRFMPVQRSPGWWWEQDPVFDLKHHLDVVLDRFSPDELQDWVSARLNQPLPLYRPRWKFWLAPNAEGGAALILRLHHCYADGLSLLGIFDRLCPPSPQQHPALYGAAETPQLARWSTAAKAWLERLVANETATRGEVGVTDAEAPATDRMQQAGRSLERVAANGLKLLNEISEFLVEPADTPSDLKRPLLGRRQC